MKILITGVGGPTPRSVAKSLRRYSSYADYRLVGTDINKHAIGLYEKDLFDVSYLVPPASASAYWYSIEKIIRDEKIEYALVQPELEVLEWSRRLKADGKLPCKVLLPDYELVKVLINKAKTTRILEKHPNLVPRSFSFQRDALDKKALMDTLPFPFWIRSASGTSGLGSLKINNESSLDNWMVINPNVQEFIAGEYLPGRNYACKLLYHKGKLVQAACAERVSYIMAKVAPSGITGNTSFGRLLNRPDLFRVSSAAMDKLFEETQTPKHGFFTVDLKENAEGVPLVTEVNVRQVAFNNCFAAGGVNFSESTLKLLAGDELQNPEVLHRFKEGLIFLRDVDEDPILMQEDELLTATNIIPKRTRKKVLRKAIPATRREKSPVIETQRIASSDIQNT